MLDLRGLFFVVDVIVLLVDRRRVDVQRGLKEHWTDVLEVRAARPEPRRHSAGGGGGHEVSEGERLL